MARSTVKRQRRAPLLVGGDCVGLNGMCIALEMLGVEYKLRFVCEKDASAQAVLARNFQYDILQPDVFTRDLNETPYVDLYTAGFPCVSYSSLGRGEGLQHEQGHVGLHCLMYISNHRPRCFLLENVKALTSQKFVDTFHLILNYLKGIKD